MVSGHRLQRPVLPRVASVLSPHRAWDNLKKALKGEFEESVWDHLSGTTSAPFEAGENRQIAVKVIDDRGNELMVVEKALMNPASEEVLDPILNSTSRRGPMATAERATASAFLKAFLNAYNNAGLRQ